jgi:single-strand DNA-binding protein
MVTPDMTRALRTSAIAVVGLTVVGAIAAVIDPSLGPGTRPHPMITPGLAAAWSIWQSNLRVLAVPFVLAALRFADTALGRTVGDVIIAALTAYSTLTVGLAIGRWQWALIPYLPHLPFEWAALSLAVGAWLRVRQHAVDWLGLAGLGGVIVVLLAGAAVLETWATPHRVADVGHRRVAAGAVVLSPLEWPRVRWRSAQRASAERWLVALTPSNPDPFKGGITRMNHVSLIGNLTRDPELRTTPSGTSVSDLRLAINRPKRGGEDQGADYVDVVCWGTTAENCAKYLAKGRPIAVSGRLRHSEWESDTGRRQKLEVVADQIDFLNANTPNASEPAAEEPAAA